jgi:hypothetical protein
MEEKKEGHNMNENHEISEEFKQKVEQFRKKLLHYGELSPKDKALYDFIADICEEEEEKEHE